jgi:hypothetical protein
MRAIALIALLLLAGCTHGSYRVSTDIIDSLETGGEWYAKAPEIIYLALRGDKSVVDRLFLLIPMATKDDCTCLAGAPGDAAAIVIAREFELDPTLGIFGTMNAEDRKHAFRYICAAPPVDWEGEKEKIKARYAIGTPDDAH